MNRHARRWAATAVFAAGAVLIFALMNFSSLPAKMPRQDHAKPASSANVLAINAAAKNNAEQVRILPSTIADPERVLRSGSLRGSAADGSLSWTEDGRLLSNRELRRLFDYYLSTIGELDTGAIRELLSKQLLAEYPAEIVAQALTIFDRYRDYELALMQLPPDPELRSQLARLHKLRYQYLGADLADAFFHDEESYAAYTVALRDIATDPNLDPQQRETRRAEIEAQLPDSVRTDRAIAQTPALIDAQENHFAATNADAETRHDARVALWGEEAAQRLDVLDGERADWQARVLAYRDGRDAIDADTSLTAAQRTAALDDLLSRNFQDNERLRILSLQQEGLLAGPSG